MSKFTLQWKVSVTDKGKEKIRYFKNFRTAHKAAEELRAAGLTVDIRPLEPGEAVAQ